MGTVGNTASTHHVSWQSGVPLAWVIGFSALQLTAGIAATIYGWPFAAAPVALLVLFIAALFPRIGLILLMISMFSKHSIPGTNGIYVSDILSIPVMAGAIIHRFSLNQKATNHHPLWAPLIAIIVYFGLSIAWASYPMPAFINWLRHAQLIVLALLIADTVEVDDILKILNVMAIVTFAISIYTISEFVAVGGRQRIFGPAGWFFNTFLAIAMIHAGVGAILSERRVARLWWITCAGVCFLGLIATQTRSAMLQALIGIAVAISVAWYWAGRNAEYVIRRRIFTLVAVTVGMIVVFLFGQIVLFEAASARVEQALEGRSNTIFIRLLLWKTGWMVFTESPILGSGLGQASRWSERFNFFHLDPASPRAGGLGVHNDAITYLAETGIIGTGLIFWLFWVVSRMCWKLLARSHRRADARQVLYLAAPIGAIIAHYFYSAYLFYSIGGMVVAFYFGMLTKLYMSKANNDLEVTAGTVQ